MDRSSPARTEIQERTKGCGERSSHSATISPQIKQIALIPWCPWRYCGCRHHHPKGSPMVTSRLFEDYIEDLKRLKACRKKPMHVIQAGEMLDLEKIFGPSPVEDSHRELVKPFQRHSASRVA